MNAEISAFTNMTEVLRFVNADISAFTNIRPSVNAEISAFTNHEIMRMQNFLHSHLATKSGQV